MPTRKKATKGDKSTPYPDIGRDSLIGLRNDSVKLKINKIYLLY